MAEPRRTCVGCRAVTDASRLLRIAVVDGVAVPDVGAILPGRGCWLHADPACLATALKRRAVTRALPAQRVDEDALRAIVESTWHNAAEKR